MGWNARLTIDTGAETLTPLDLDYSDPGGYGWSMTYNVSPMYREAFGHSIMDLNGLPAPEAADRMEAALRDMENNPTKYKAMNPPNGWGSYEAAMSILRQMIPICRQHPKATFEIG